MEVGVGRGRTLVTRVLNLVTGNPRFTQGTLGPCIFVTSNDGRDSNPLLREVKLGVVVVVILEVFWFLVFIFPCCDLLKSC